MKNSTGFTLIELMVTITVAAILLTLALPSFRDLLEKRRLVGAAEYVFEQLMYARTEAIKRSKPIIVDFSANNTTTWSFGFTDKNTDPACDSAVASAADASACTIDFDNDPGTSDLVLKTFDDTDFEGIRMRGRAGTAPSFGTTSNPCTSTEANETCFDPLWGTARNGSVVLCTSDTYELQVMVGGLGRASLCSPAAYDSPNASCGHAQANYRKVPGYPTCP